MKIILTIIIGAFTLMGTMLFNAIIGGILFRITYPHLFVLFPKLAGTGLLGDNLSLFDCICIVWILTWLFSLIKPSK